MTRDHVTEAVSVPGTNGNERQAAVQAWLAAAARGEHLTGVALAERFGRSDGWGRARVREARRTAARSERNTAVTGIPEMAANPVPAAPGERAAANERHAAVTGAPEMAAPVPATTAVPAPVAPTVAGGDRPGADGTGEVPAWVGQVSVAAVLLVAAAAAVASVEHLADLARLAGVRGWRAWLLPASLDGLVVASSMCLYRAHLLAQRAGLLAWSALLAGLAASVAGNVLSVYPELVPEAWLKVTVGGSAPVALVLSFDLALRQTRTAPTRREQPARHGTPPAASSVTGTGRDT